MILLRIVLPGKSFLIKYHGHSILFDFEQKKHLFYLGSGDKMYLVWKVE